MTTFNIDARGLSCPEPLMLVKARMRSLQPGDELILLSDDPVSRRDVPAYCRYLGHELLALPDEDHPCRFVLRKAAQALPPRAGKSVNSSSFC